MHDYIWCSNTEVLSEYADICTFMSLANELCVTENGSIMVDKRLVYMEKNIRSRTDPRGTLE